MSNQSAHAIFDALGEPVRRNILELLGGGPLPVGQLADRLPVGRPAVSKHLRVLADAGLVRHDSVGTRNLYALAPRGMAAAQQWLVGVWDVALDRYAEAIRKARQDKEFCDMSDLSPIRREVLVDADPDLAFAVFTERIGQWWPVAEPSVHGEGASVAFTDGAIVETASSGAVAVWGTVTTWDPPSTLAFTWHPGHDGDRASNVTVTFAAAGEQTLVRLEHAGWEVFDSPEAAREEYSEGWPMVLDLYGNAFGETWVALLHVPGPHGPEGPVFADPRFGDHVAFLQRMMAAGYLVAAGSFQDELGSGMTILRLPGANRLDEATRLATVDDLSVANGFFSVAVRPWNVVMSA